MASITRTAQAEWQGTGTEGKGALMTKSGVLSATQYGFNTRFGDQKGTKPEALIASGTCGGALPWRLPSPSSARASRRADLGFLRPSRWSLRAQVSGSPSRP
jgi:hypothetical protein